MFNSDKIRYLEKSMIDLKCRQSSSDLELKKLQVTVDHIVETLGIGWDLTRMGILEAYPFIPSNKIYQIEESIRDLQSVVFPKKVCQKCKQEVK